jgi:hypothetical protein
MLYFCTGDHPTDHNLSRLDHLASLDRFDGDAEQMHGWLVAVIQSIRALPRVASTHFTGYYFLGDAHFKMSAERRIATWQKLVAELRDHVDAAHADPALRSDNPHGAPDVSDRHESLGERLIALCDRLDRASWGTSEFDNILAEIGADAVGDIRADVRELKKLSARKRVPDLGEHRYWIVRHIGHIRMIADRLHHLG